MKKNLVISLEEAKKLYSTSSKEMKFVFETTFGKGSFLSVDNISSFDDVLDILGESLNLPYKLPKTPEEKSDNALYKLRKICKVYNESTGKTVDRTTANYRYFPYIYLNGVSRVLNVDGWVFSVCYPAGLDFIDRNHAVKSTELFKDIYEDFYNIKLKK